MVTIDGINSTNVSFSFPMQDDGDSPLTGMYIYFRDSIVTNYQQITSCLGDSNIVASL